MTPRSRCCRIPISAATRTPRAQDAAARELLEQMSPELEVEGEMHGDSPCRKPAAGGIPASRLKGAANLLINANLDAAHRLQLLKITGGEGITIAPSCWAQTSRCTFSFHRRQDAL